jgi:hypothetical protein
MRLVDDWKRVLRYSWSVRMVVIVGVLGALPMLAPLLEGRVSLVVYALAIVLSTTLGVLSRVIEQRELHTDA